MPRKPRFVSGVKRHVSESIKLNSGKPCLVGGELHIIKSPSTAGKRSGITALSIVASPLE